ncbi:MAG: PASTA domain-containing protein [Bacteroidia bacterium]
MDKIKAFFKNIFVKNLIIIGILGILVLWVTECQLRRQTLNGVKIQVPDFTGLDESDVQRMCEQRQLNYVVKDTAFIKKMLKRTMVDQMPEAESWVKPGRTIYLTINSDKPPMVKLQDLTSLQERGAIRILQNDGFMVDPDSEYEPDPGLDWVLKVKVNDEEIEWGSKLPKGTTITLVLGDGSTDGGPIKAPNLLGRDFNLIPNFMYMQNKILGDVDSTELNGPLSIAKVYRQDPRPGIKIKPSDPIHIWICDSFTYNDIYKFNIDQFSEPKDTTPY